MGLLGLHNPLLGASLDLNPALIEMQTIPYSFNQIPPFIFRNAHKTSVKYTDVVRFIHWCEIFVIIAVE